MNDSKEIIRKAKEGDQEAIGILYQEYQSRGVAIAKRYVKTQENAEDMYQDSFIKAMNHLDSFDENQPFGPWINTIIINTSKNFLEKKTVYTFSDLSDEEISFEETIEAPDSSIMSDEYLNKDELAGIIDEILARLPEAQRQAVVLHYYKGMSVKDIAALQEVPEDTVKSRLNYSRKKVGNAIEDYQKKKGVRLYTITIVPALLYLYFKNSMSVYACELEDSFVNEKNKEVCHRTATNSIDTDNLKKVVRTETKNIVRKKMGKRLFLGILVATVSMGGAVAIFAKLNKVSENREHIETSDYALDNHNPAYDESEDYDNNSFDVLKDEDSKDTIKENEDNYLATSEEGEFHEENEFIEEESEDELEESHDIPEGAIPLYSEECSYVMTGANNLRTTDDGRYLLDFASVKYSGLYRMTNEEYELLLSGVSIQTPEDTIVLGKKGTREVVCYTVGDEEDPSLEYYVNAESGNHYVTVVDVEHSDNDNRKMYTNGETEMSGITVVLADYATILACTEPDTYMYYYYHMDVITEAFDNGTITLDQKYTKVSINEYGEIQSLGYDVAG